MSHDDAALIAEAESFLDELFTTGVPLQPLLNNGAFPEGWPERYLAFVERVVERYGDTEPFPREVLAVLYNASVYCTKRYFDWQRLTGGVNDKTESVVNRVRWGGDSLVLGQFWRRQRPGV